MLQSSCQKLPNNPKTFPGFHANLLKHYIQNDPLLFPDHEPAQPLPVITEDGTEEWFINKIVDARWRGRGVQYLVHYDGYGKEYDEWWPASEMQDTNALDFWEAENGTKV